MSELFNASGAYDPTPAKAIHNTLPKPQPGEVWELDNGMKAIVINKAKHGVLLTLCYDKPINEQVPIVCRDNVFYAYQDAMSCYPVSKFVKLIDLCDHDQFVEFGRTLRRSVFGEFEEPTVTKTIHITNYDMDSIIGYYSLNHNLACAVEAILEDGNLKKAIDRLQREINKYGG